MKKRILMTFVAASSLMFAACGGGNNNATPADNQTATDNKTATESNAANDAIIPVDASATLDKTFENDKFSVQYPSALTPKTVEGSDFFIANESGEVTFNFTWNTEGPAISDLQSLLENYVYMLKSQGTVETQAVKGNKFVIKVSDENTTKYAFGVMKEDKVGVMGEYSYPKENAADFEKYAGALINSIKFK